MKIQTLFASVLLLFGASLVSAQQITRCGGPANALYINWPSILFDDCRTGYNPYETRLNSGNIQNLTLAWQYSGSGPVFGSVAVVNNVAYFASEDASVYAVNATTGTFIWKYTTGYSIVGTPTVATGAVFFGSGDDNTYALDAKTGSLLWKYATGNAVGGSQGVASGAVYVGSADGIYALNAHTGALLWKYNTSEALDAGVTVVNGVVYTVSTSGNLFAVNAGNGTLLWKFAIGNNPNVYPPTVINGVVYYAQGLDLFAINALTGTLLWHKHPSGFTYLNSMAIAYGMIFAVGSSNDPEQSFPTTYAFDQKTGTELWHSFETGTYAAGVVVANGLLYVYSSGPNHPSGALTILDANTGIGVASYDLPGASVSPAVANGVVYVPFIGVQGGLLAFHLPSE